MREFRIGTKRCGYITNENILVVEKSREKHLHHTLDAYGLNLGMLLAAGRRGVSKIRVVVDGAATDVSWSQLKTFAHYRNPKPPHDKQVMVPSRLLTDGVTHEGLDED